MVTTAIFKKREWMEAFDLSEAFDLLLHELASKSCIPCMCEAMAKNSHYSEIILSSPSEIGYCQCGGEHTQF